jgi:spore maturation protein CgeB
MRIGVVGSDTPDRFANNIGDALRRMGHEVSQLGPAYPDHKNGQIHKVASLARMALPRFDERAQLRIAQAGLDAECEMVLNIDLRLMPGTVNRLKLGGARVAFWFPDAVTNLGRQLMVMGQYDSLFFKEPQIVERLRSNLDLPAYYLPEACNPRWHRPLVPAGTDPYLVAAGNMYPVRVRLLERLMNKGIPIKLYGPGVPRWIGDTSVRGVHTGKSIFREEKARIYRSAAGVLNSLHPGEIAGVNARLFEAAGSGAAVVTECRPGLPELFDVDVEVLAFHDFDELVEQATRLLNEPGLTARLGEAAAQRAHRDHTYEKRISVILEKTM